MEGLWNDWPYSTVNKLFVDKIKHDEFIKM